MDLPTPSPSTNILSAIHGLNTLEAFPSSSMQELHVFAESHGDRTAVIPQLKNILTTTSLVSMALSSHSSLAVSDPKSVSLMRQHAGLIQELNVAQTNLALRMKALKERHSVDYGEDTPSSKVSLVAWFLDQMKSWATAAEMQVFDEPETDGKLNVVLAGKILVLDVEFSVRRIGDEDELDLISLKSSHASPLDAPATSSSSSPTAGVSLDTFLIMILREYLAEIQKDQADMDPAQVARLGRSLQKSLQYIMKLDNLAQRKVEGGSRWFTEVDDLGSVAMQIVPREAEMAAKSLGLAQAPLDILLLRGHALPLPYLHMPSLSFLVYLSPLCYLSLLRSPPFSEASSMIDIPMDTLRSYLSRNTLAKGTVVATLSLQRSSQPSHFTQAHGRPTFPLVSTVEPPDENLDHILPVDNGQDSWVLEFGPDGVVLSQSRMWEIQLLLGLTPSVDSMQIMSFAYTGSWVDLLIQGPTQMLYHETYRATYVSPTESHPPLRLRLTAAQEPGFILRKIRVQSMRDIWSIFEIVKEQSWYNNLLYSYHWIPEDIGNEGLGAVKGISKDIDSLLNGDVTPKHIPVSIYIDPPIPPSLFQPPLHREHPTVTMVFPSKGPGGPLINATIKLDTSSNSCVRVLINGFPAPRSCEEAVRRGGGLALAGRFWMEKSSH
ncbi:hypothetical protein BU17DRAFT_46567 [Hysterangium stoloniferum]|nr:hypothetical protein BU17DRAFT_46567 [Hysterangium stoloniferum]